MPTRHRELIDSFVSTVHIGFSVFATFASAFKVRDPLFYCHINIMVSLDLDTQDFAMKPSTSGVRRDSRRNCRI